MSKWLETANGSMGNSQGVQWIEGSKYSRKSNRIRSNVIASILDRIISSLFAGLRLLLRIYEGQAARL